MCEIRFKILTHCVTADVWTLPPPSRVSMESVDMRHVLRWHPLQTPCDTAVRYSVQFQGEFELTVLNGSWVDASECQQTPHTHCDLTFDLGSDSDYNLHVQAQCGSQLSPWTALSPPFNRRDTVLMAPEMVVTAMGNALQVSFEKLPLTAVVRVTMWKRGNEQQVRVHFVPFLCVSAFEVLFPAFSPLLSLPCPQGLLFFFSLFCFIPLVCFFSRSIFYPHISPFS
uniref:Fibronectin type-III domain-containing protein n=1 Tax=Dicentrarchus labrax TaxID=13489 RepID=A0A8C4HKE8_DICLA